MSRLQIETAAANQSGAMEAETISKNGRSLKSLMSKVNILKFVLALFVVVSLGVGLSACDNATSQSSNSNASVRWEYKVVDIGGLYEQREAAFNELGKDGWEYIGFSSTGNGYSNGQVFKRRLP